MTSPSTSPARRPRPGEHVEVDVIGFDRRGRAVGRAGDERVVLRGGLPGERVEARVRRKRKGRLEAQRLTVLRPSPDAVEPRCAHVGSCGGCSTQGLAYEAQLRHKREAVRAVLREHDLDVAVEAVIGAAEPFGYRNKMDFTFGSRRWVETHEPDDVERDFALGLHVPGVFDKVLDVETCHLQFEEGNAILASVRALARASGAPAWDTRAHQGLWRHLVLRKAFTSGEVLVDLVVSRDDPVAEELLTELVRRHREITTAVLSVTTRLASVAVAETRRVVHGPGTLTEELGGVTFRVSPGAFFQTNTPQAERLVELVRAAARPGPDDAVWDLCCGAGTFALPLARAAGTVLGFELSAEAIADARANARANGIENVEFEVGDMADLLRPEDPAAEGSSPARPAPTIAIVDPPRAGLHPKAFAGLVRARPQRIVWVSCNLAAAAADLARLVAEGWTLVRVQPVDLFPHTPHVETVVTLERRA